MSIIWLALVRYSYTAYDFMNVFNITLISFERNREKDNTYTRDKYEGKPF